MQRIMKMVMEIKQKLTRIRLEETNESELV